LHPRRGFLADFAAVVDTAGQSSIDNPDTGGRDGSTATVDDVPSAVDNVQSSVDDISSSVESLHSLLDEVTSSLSNICLEINAAC
jgi:hypothetical protein